MQQTPPLITSPWTPDIKQVRAWLEKMIAALRFVEVVTAILALIQRMCDINTELTKQVAHLRRKRPRSETLRRIEQQLALPLGESADPSEHADPTQKRSGNRQRSRRGRHPGRAPFPAHLERVEVTNPVPDALRICPVCGTRMTTVGHSRCEVLNVIPAKVIVQVRLDECVACPKDDTIVSAPTPPAIVERGKLGDTLIVEALCDKYLEHIPVERQCTRWQRYGVRIAPQTLGRSVTAAIDLLMPIATLIQEQTRAPGLLGTDETSIRILDPEAPGGVRWGAMWCWTNARWVSFFYSPSGDSNSVRRFLGEDLARTVQCDGTHITSFLERAGGKRPGCWSHGRRRLAEAARQGDTRALEGLHKIAGIFAVERDCTLSGANAQQRLEQRTLRTRPILDDLRGWIDQQRQCVPPKTPLGRALRYLRRQWHRLLLFLEDGNIEATNNRRERELRKLVLGRKNWLFTWDDVGGERTGAILTIVATCIAHDVNPRGYLHLVTKLIVGGWKQSRLRDLLPDRMLRAHPELSVALPRKLPSGPEPPLLPRLT
jgi:transposase